LLVESLPVLDDVLRTHAVALGDDFAAYRNHAYRVVNFCAALCPLDAGQLRKVELAAAYHDLGIWTGRTFDYLAPSMALACDHLAMAGLPEWQPEVSRMIQEHHKLRRYRGEPGWLVEPFRRADWVDVSNGLIAFGLRADLLQRTFHVWPTAGFHKRLVQLTLRRASAHPLNPLPMVRF
jgi:hypothetical protein